jgi:alkylation response protein AidB-like acyl-CoA dehydrogenase
MSDDVNLLDTDVEASLRSAIRAMLESRCDPRDVAAAYDGNRALTATLWKAITAELGLAGLLVPEDRGGAGASAREASVVLDELGRFVAPVPFLTSSVIATTVALESDSGLAAGERTAALLMPFSASSDSQLPAFTRDGAGHLSGRASSVAGALDSDVLLAAVATGGGVEVYAVPAAAATVEPVVSLDMTRPLADVTLAGAAGELLVAAPGGAAAVRRGLQAGEALLPSEQAGLAAWCLATTVDYLLVRRQFGRVVGGFQALKHRLADLFIEVESASAAARYAAGASAAGHADAAIAAAVAQSFCGNAAVHAAEEAIQLHGGIGMTWEHPAHLYLKRAKADQIGLGLPGHHRAVLAGLTDLPGPVAAAAKA